MKCINCNVEFQGKRADARFCSNRCRALYSKHKRNPLSATTSVKRNLSATVGISATTAQAQPAEIKRTRTVESEAHAPVVQVKPPVQHTNSMKVGYVPPDPKQTIPVAPIPKQRQGIPSRPDNISDSQYNYIKHKAGVM